MANSLAEPPKLEVIDLDIAHENNTARGNSPHSALTVTKGLRTETPRAITRVFPDLRYVSAAVDSTP